MRENRLLIDNQFKVTADDFVIMVHRLIFQYMTEIINEGGVSIRVTDIDAAFNRDTLNRAYYDHAGGMKFLTEMNTYAEPKDFKRHVTNLKKWALLRTFAKEGIDVTYYHIPSRLVNDLFPYKQKSLKEKTPNEWEIETNRRFRQTSLEDMKQHFSELVSKINDSVASSMDASFEPVDIFKEIDEPVPIVKGFMRTGEIAQIYSEAGNGKTWLGLNLSFALSNGISLGYGDGNKLQSESVGVAYFDFELGETGIIPRAKLLNSAYKDMYTKETDPTVPYIVCPDPLAYANKGLEAFFMDQFKKLQERSDIKVIIADCFYKIFTGSKKEGNQSLDLNNMVDVTKVLSVLENFSRAGYSVIYFDHSGKDNAHGKNGSIGSSAKSAEATCIWELILDKVNGVYILKNHKQREACYNEIKIYTENRPVETEKDKRNCFVIKPYNPFAGIETEEMELQKAAAKKEQYKEQYDFVTASENGVTKSEWNTRFGGFPTAASTEKMGLWFSGKNKRQDNIPSGRVYLSLEDALRINNPDSRKD